MNVCHVGNNELFPVKLNCHNFSLSIDQEASEDAMSSLYKYVKPYYYYYYIEYEIYLQLFYAKYSQLSHW